MQKFTEAANWPSRCVNNSCFRWVSGGVTKRAELIDCTSLTSDMFYVVFLKRLWGRGHRKYSSPFSHFTAQITPFEENKA